MSSELIVAKIPYFHVFAHYARFARGRSHLCKCDQAMQRLNLDDQSHVMLILAYTDTQSRIKQVISFIVVCYLATTLNACYWENQDPTKTYRKYNIANILCTASSVVERKTVS